MFSKPIHLSSLALLLALNLALSACGSAINPEEQLATAQALAATQIAATIAALPSHTPTSSPTATSTPTSTLTPTETTTPSATPTPTAGVLPGAMLMYFIAVENGEPQGCGDQLVGVSTGYLPTGDPVEDVRTALSRQFGTGGLYVAGLYNPLYASSIIIESVAFEDAYGEIVVRTTGSINKGDDHCDWDRIRLMVNATARAAAGGQSVEIRLNSNSFNDMVSGDHK